MVSSFIAQYLQTNAPLLLLLIGLFLASFGMESNQRFGNRTLRILILALFLLSACVFHMKDTSFLLMENGSRTLFFFIDYGIWPCLLYGLTILIPSQYSEKHDLYLLIPAIINILLCGSAFITDIIFYFDESAQLCCTTLGAYFWIICAFYAVVIAMRLIRMINYDKVIESLMLIFAYLACIACAVLNLAAGTKIDICLCAAIWLALFHLYIYMQPARRDLLTGLLSRQCWYQDCVRYESRITAIAVFDLNGIHKINRTYGYFTADQTLIDVSNAMMDCVKPGTRIYRLDADEFCFMFLGADMKQVTSMIEEVNLSLEPTRQTCCAGYAVRQSEETVYDLKLRADISLSENRRSYYSSPEINRRTACDESKNG